MLRIIRSYTSGSVLLNADRAKDNYGRSSAIVEDKLNMNERKQRTVNLSAFVQANSHANNSTPRRWCGHNVGQRYSNTQLQENKGRGHRPGEAEAFWTPSVSLSNNCSNQQGNVPSLSAPISPRSWERWTTTNVSPPLPM